MNKYTHEQRKMIAEYLKSEVLTLEPMFNQIYKSYIEEKINELKKTTFGEVKNQVGVKLKFILTGKIIVVARKEKTLDILYFDVKNSVFFDDSSISDKDEVEIVNE